MKKVLSIVLSIVMVLCMMPAMAFAGTADFTDAADIQHDAAVDTLVALGVLEGYPDDSFQPAKVVTRAEMAKIIATVLNGGEAPVLSTTTTSYGDTQGHWAAGYIEYCTSLGIVEGVGAGQFQPDAPVTAEQAAKMILVAQGYNAAVEGMTGAAWASNTNVLANQNNLYDELKDIDTAAGAVRDDIAQMIYNVLNEAVIVKSNSVNKVNGEVVTTYAPSEDDTVLSKYFATGDDIVGTIEKITYSTKTGKYTYTIDPVDAQAADVELTTTADYTALYMMPVKAIVAAKDKAVYGMFPNESAVVYEGLFGDITSVNAGKATIAGTEYKVNDGVTLAANTAVAEFGAWTQQNQAPAITAYSEIKLIDSNDDGKIDAMTYAPVKVERVTFVGVTSFSTTTTFTGKAFTAEDIVVYDGIAKDDYVVITEDLVLGKTLITKAAALDNAKVTSKTGATSAVVGGETYKLVADNVLVGYSYDAAIVNGYLAMVSQPIGASFSTADYAVVTAKQIETATTHDGVVKTTRVLTAAGETKVLELDTAVNGHENNATNTMAQADYSGIVKLSENEGKYTMKNLANASNVSTTPYTSDLTFVEKDDDAAAHITQGTGQNVTKYSIDADAVVFVANVDAKGNVTYNVITGADLAAKTDADVKEVLVKVNPNTGYASVVMALVESVDATTAHYAVVYGDTVKTEVSAGKYVYEYNLSTGKFKTPETTSVNAPTSVTKAQIVSYDINSKGEIINVVVEGHNTGLWENAVVKYDGTKIAFDVDGTNTTDDYNITKDTVIMYVDSSDNNKVYEGGTVRLAEKSGNAYVDNVLAKATGSDIVLLVVDVKNAMN